MIKFIIRSFCSLCLLVGTVSPSLFFWLIWYLVQPDSSLVRLLLIALGLFAFFPTQLLVGGFGLTMIAGVWVTGKK